MVCGGSMAGLGTIFTHEGQRLRSEVINKLNFSDSIFLSSKIYFLKSALTQGLFQQLSAIWIWNVLTGFPGDSVVKNLPANEGDTGLIPGLGRSLGGRNGNPLLPGASVRNSARGKGHEEGGSAYAKAGLSLRSLPGNSRASTPKTRVYLFSALCSHLHLWLYGGLSPTTSLWKKS